MLDTDTQIDWREFSDREAWQAEIAIDLADVADVADDGSF
jgi:hypothetical protein